MTRLLCLLQSSVYLTQLSFHTAKHDQGVTDTCVCVCVVTMETTGHQQLGFLRNLKFHSAVERKDVLRFSIYVQVWCPAWTRPQSSDQSENTWHTACTEKSLRINRMRSYAALARGYILAVLQTELNRNALCSEIIKINKMLLYKLHFSCYVSR